jgi:hypothetical protein
MKGHCCKTCGDCSGCTGRVARKKQIKEEAAKLEAAKKKFAKKKCDTSPYGSCQNENVLKKCFQKDMKNRCCKECPKWRSKMTALSRKASSSRPSAAQVRETFDNFLEKYGTSKPCPKWWRAPETYSESWQEHIGMLESEWKRCNKEQERRRQRQSSSYMCNTSPYGSSQNENVLKKCFQKDMKNRCCKECPKWRSEMTALSRKASSSGPSAAQVRETFDNFLEKYGTSSPCPKWWRARETYPEAWQEHIGMLESEWERCNEEQRRQRQSSSNEVVMQSKLDARASSYASEHRANVHASPVDISDEESGDGSASSDPISTTLTVIGALAGSMCATVLMMAGVRQCRSQKSTMRSTSRLSGEKVTPPPSPSPPPPPPSNPLQFSRPSDACV